MTEDRTMKTFNQFIAQIQTAKKIIDVERLRCDAGSEATTGVVDVRDLRELDELCDRRIMMLLGLELQELETELRAAGVRDPIHSAELRERRRDILGSLFSLGSSLVGHVELEVQQA